MSEKEQQEYKKQTGKRPLYFNKPSNDFKAWLNNIDENDLKELEELAKLEELEGKDFDNLKEEEELMEQYELETDKNAITTKKTLRKSYIKWKNNGKEEIKELIKKSSQLKYWF